MPGLVLSVVVCSALFLLIGHKREVLNGIFAITYTANYAAIMTGHHLSGFGHAWSLAVEEHFYIIWPTVLLLLIRRFRTWQVAVVIAILCLLVLIWRGYLAQSGVDRQLWLYVGSIERLDAMLYGAIAAVLVTGRLHRLNAWVSWLLPLGVLALLLSISTEIAAMWSSTLLGLAGTAVVLALDAHPCGGARRLLSTQWLVSVGVLSYSLYLWHLPIYQLVENILGREIEYKILALGLTWVAAWASYHHFEVPVRAKLRAWADLKFAT